MKKLLLLLGMISTIAVAQSDQEYYPIKRCCSDAQSTWYNAGPDRAWRENNISPDSFTIYRRSDDRPISFADLAEQPQISGFEQSVYTTPK